MPLRYDAGRWDSADAGCRQNSERQKRKDEQAAGTTFQQRLFSQLESDPQCAFLLAPVLQLGSALTAATMQTMSSRRCASTRLATAAPSSATDR